MPPSDMSGAVEVRDRGPRYRSSRYEICIVAKGGAQGFVMRHARDAVIAERFASLIRSLLATWVES